MTGLEVTRWCAAIGCTTRVRAEDVMCGPHWRLVPRPLRLRIWGTRGDGGHQQHRELIAGAARAVAASSNRSGAAVAPAATTSAPTGRPPEIRGGNGSGGRALQHGRGPPGRRRL